MAAQFRRSRNTARGVEPDPARTTVAPTQRAEDLLRQVCVQAELDPVPEVRVRPGNTASIGRVGARLVVTVSPLLLTEDDDVVKAVVAHELGHISDLDRVEYSLALSVTWPLVGALGVAGADLVGAPHPAGALIAVPVLVEAVRRCRHARRRELACDAWACALGYGPALARLFQKSADRAAAKPRAVRAVLAGFAPLSTHPSAAHRVAALTRRAQRRGRAAHVQVGPGARRPAHPGPR